MSLLRRCAHLFRRTPLHPQWLLEARQAPGGLAQLRGSLLDIGAGDRWIERELGEGVDYVALDYPPTGRDLYGLRPQVFADAAALPFADASFDAVVCLEVLEHVAAPEAVLAEIARVLRPGGTLWLSLPFLYPIHDAPYDFQRFTEHGLRRSLSNAALDVVELRRSGDALSSACLLLALSIAGGLETLPRAAVVVLMPLALPFILLVNLGGWAGAKLWPDWQAMSQGYQLRACRR